MKDSEHNGDGERTRAVIYCRVSTKRQKEEGHGLESQEHRCRQYAAAKGYEVEAVFPDDITGEGDFMKRAGMVALLAYLDARPDERYVVIFDDLKRLARDTDVHRKLRGAIGSVGGKLESPSIEFGEDADSRMVENLLASVSQHQREKNTEQVRNRMKARCMNGYWVFHAPYGYRYVEAERGSGKVLVRDEPLASVIADAFEGYASGRFGSMAEVKRFFESQPAFPKDFPNGDIRQWKVNRILSNRLYAGYIEVPKWGIAPCPAKHKALVSLATFQAVQDRVNGKRLGPSRKDMSTDFPLRGFVCCSECGRPLSGGWSKGKYKHYAYYI